MKKKSKMTVGAQLIMTLGLMMLSMFIVGACGYLMRNNSVDGDRTLWELWKDAGWSGNGICTVSGSQSPA